MVENGTKITYIDFSVNYIQKYSSIFFYSQYKNWEDLDIMKEYYKYDSHRFKYRANYLLLE